MKKSDFYTIKDSAICFIHSGNTYPTAEYKTIQVRIKPVLKDTFSTILNATTNAMTSSFGNGNELAQLIVDIDFQKGREEIIMNEKPLVRGNMNYYETLEHAKKLRNAIRKDIEDINNN